MRGTACALPGYAGLGMANAVQLQFYPASHVDERTFDLVGVIGAYDAEIRCG